MFISMNWINDYVDLSGIETEELVKRFNLATAEIEARASPRKPRVQILFRSSLLTTLLVAWRRKAFGT